MGTVKTAIANARVKIRDRDKNLFIYDDELIAIINGILENIYTSLVYAQSNLVYAIGSVTTVADTAEYTPSFTTKGGFLEEASWVDGEDWFLQQTFEPEKIKYDYSSSTSEPELFYVTEDSKIGYLYVPDDEYTIYHTYWKPFTAISNTMDSLPWEGIWDRVVERSLVVELLEIMEKDTSRQAVMTQMEWDKAMNLTYSRGVRPAIIVSDMFSVDGI